MAFDFAGKRIVITGGSRGIGRAIALGFATVGADVSICARSAAPLESTRAEIAGTGRRAHAAVCDLADGPAVSRYVAAAGAELGGIDVLVNNASGFGMGDNEAGWAAGLAVDVMATVRASHAALPMLEAARGSSIINISSISGLRASIRAPAYGAVKVAMMHYTASQAAALARKGIRVNCIA
ncbi:MAG: SDR family NAD(P)-dependent oxidoreductase, partial [Burkholderiaceae bacterium]